MCFYSITIYAMVILLVLTANPIQGNYYKSIDDEIMLPSNDIQIGKLAMHIAQ